MISLVVISYKIQDQNLDFLQGITTMIPVGVMVSGVAMLCVAMYRMYIIYIYSGSMYGTFTYIYHRNQLNVGKYTPYVNPMGYGSNMDGRSPLTVITKPT